MPSKNIIKEKDDLASSPPNKGSAPLPKESLWLRVFSGVILAAVFFAALYFADPFIHIFVGIVVVFLSREWCRLVGTTSTGVFLMFCSAVLSALYGSVFMGYTIEVGFGLVAVAAFLYFLGIVLGKQVVRWLAVGLVYIYFPMFSVLWVIGHFKIGALFVLGIFVFIASNDTFAYFTGKAFGGAKLAPRISPGKTWSGLIGGILGASLVGAVAAYFYSSHAIVIVLLAFAVGSLANVGDLFESGIKRYFGVKDTGASIPGHGGFLDRLDSVLFVAPLSAIFLWAGEKNLLGDHVRLFVNSLDIAL